MIVIYHEKEAATTTHSHGNTINKRNLVVGAWWPLYATKPLTWKHSSQGIPKSTTRCYWRSKVPWNTTEWSYAIKLLPLHLSYQTACRRMSGTWWIQIKQFFWRTANLSHHKTTSSSEYFAKYGKEWGCVWQCFNFTINRCIAGIRGVAPGRGQGWGIIIIIIHEVKLSSILWLENSKIIIIKLHLYSTISHKLCSNVLRKGLGLYKSTTVAVWLCCFPSWVNES